MELTAAMFKDMLRRYGEWTPETGYGVPNFQMAERYLKEALT